MYIPRHYAQEDRGKLFEFMQNNSFGILFSHTGDEPMASHLPFVIDEVGDQGLILGHMAKANRQWRYADGQQVLVVFYGPHAYVSPTWYQEDEVVLTSQERQRLLNRHGWVGKLAVSFNLIADLLYSALDPRIRVN